MILGWVKQLGIAEYKTLRDRSVDVSVRFLPMKRDPNINYVECVEYVKRTLNAQSISYRDLSVPM